MLQLLLAVAFSAVPLTLYVPPLRSLNLFVETIEIFLQQTTLYSSRAYPRIRLACSRIWNSLQRFNRCPGDTLQSAFGVGIFWVKKLRPPDGYRLDKSIFGPFL
ncbi:hypothetical protein GIB67_040110 [Kingdonia uniflora]|uniref:Secreted protein n=1 Tax=Kingdonia uniflora TaxID=39325 RepID=A0A7J7MUN3_9MAGN|nr:hypothetical protein GIB67_040110 [Kingdonia uniflora]